METAYGGVPLLVKRNNANMAKLSIGMAKVEVTEVMGSAGKTELYETKTGGTLEFLFYRTALAPHEIGRWDQAAEVLIYKEPGEITDKHWTPICFIDGKLKGFGRNFYDDTLKIRKEVIQK
jgi:hypothetical protein